MRTIAVLTALLVLAPLAARADDAQIRRGYTLVNYYCKECHAIGLTGKSPNPLSPPFRELNKRYDVNLLAESLVEGIVVGHPSMPEFAFDPDQAQAIIAYIKSLDLPDKK